ncbi:heme lyase CcmF/NrfE family subunit [Asticcacaulis excentricus]|uniref:Cytochrome c assembly protein n=1 Tax=Asticcacaulis excentricus (strain ATCC 15261 / DSM 4724 / KCTC 12464 / NCIMB 9791 / VKM B-1370 / CB 48) TaxID=573065 RepID=E8RL63_ASTEC|nr:heme lyase CcmF/NrfE family subunit [Asticcacaulis excentricus]ADU13676.1 cytochrome c assembly protein [Asticcacaulis excentricus CB 48]
MIAELGTFSLGLAFLLSLAQALSVAGAAWRPLRGMARWSEGLSLAAAVACVLAFAALLHAFVTSDFSVSNVAKHSHTLKPLLYKISGAWGSHEGSMLLWCMVLISYGALVTLFGQGLPSGLRHKVLGVQGLLGALFCGFTLFSSNPLARLDPAPYEGQSLNPMLQDPALAFHPPLLYLGYVGFSVVFAFAVAALIEGRIGREWARWVRPWTLVAWVFLTLGIALGSFWAYYELGWGGWWFWDPVENASFMPWLAATALLHSAIVLEKRDALKSWTVFLALLAFTFSMLGAFLVRSGVLTSVHAFAVDPQRGILLLAILFITAGAGFALYVFRAATLSSGGVFSPVSRESTLVLNNLLVFVALSTVCLGTLYPLLMEALTGKTISVGTPYYNLSFVPAMSVAMLILPLASLMAWKRGDLKAVGQRLALAGGISLFLAVLGAVLMGNGEAKKVLSIGTGFLLGGWVILGSWRVLQERTHLLKVPFSESLRRFSALPLATHGMVLAHVGLGLFVMGAVVETQAKLSAVDHLRVGGALRVGAYEVRLSDIKSVVGPNYEAERGVLNVRRGGKSVCQALPERRFYPASSTVTTEVALCFQPLNDLYFVLGEPSPDGWQVRALYNPWARLIFFGPLLMAIGGVLSLCDRRLRLGLANRGKKG